MSDFIQTGAPHMVAQISGNILNPLTREVFPGTITIKDRKIADIRKEPGKQYTQTIVPPFVDAHIHIESSMLPPREFGRAAVTHGTVGAVCDPHEIANVMGVPGIDYMIENASHTPVKLHFGAPSCVPAVEFETSGAKLDAARTAELMARKNIFFLGEMMNFPGVVHSDPEVLGKIEAAHANHKPVDGHAPGLSGPDLAAYVNAGISTDHEAFTEKEALEKIKLGMKVLIREGSAAKNFNDLIGVAKTHPDQVMFCSDDKHPDELREGHINQLIARAIKAGVDPITAYRISSVNPIQHYKLNIGLLQVNDPADMVVVDDFNTAHVTDVIINGEQVVAGGKNLLSYSPSEEPNQFNARPKTLDDLKVAPEPGLLRVIQAMDGQLITREIHAKPRLENNNTVSDPDNDILKLVVVNRYADVPPAVGFINGFGLQEGAIASSVAHDAHNVIGVGTSDAEILKAINAVIANKGGLVAVHNEDTHLLPLPIAGLMSNQTADETASGYAALNDVAKNTLKSPLSAPFMTLAFMSLSVIPDLKLIDKGLFDGKTFQFTSLFAPETK